MMKGGLGALLALALVLPAGAETKPKKPRLDLRAVPRMALSPVVEHFTAELIGGDDVEEYYCPEIEWDWDDGGKSVQESDCAPYTTGTKIERRFTAEHEYRKAGTYQIKVTLRHTKGNLAIATVRVTIRPGAGDNTDQP